jgi:amino acid transporter
MFIVPAVVTVAFFAMWVAGITNPSAVVTGVQDVMGTTPDNIMTLAINTGMTTNISSFFDAFTYALPGAFWAYMGWYATTFIAGEVKEANKKLPLVVISAGVIIILVYLAASSVSALSTLNVGTRTVAGHNWSFFQAYSWLSYPASGAADAVSAARGTISNFQPAWSTGIAAIIARGLNLGWLSWIIALAGVFWLANDIPPFLLVASRTFFAMSFDRMLPESFAYVSEKWHSPVWAIIATGFAAMFGAVAESGVAGLGTYFAFAGVIGTDIFDALFLTLFCVSAMLLPLERKEIYDRAAVKHSIGTVVVLGALGTLGAAFCLWVFIKESTFFLFPTDAASMWGGIGFFLCIGIGVLLYIYFMYRNTTRGVDMRTLYISIPPE